MQAHRQGPGRPPRPASRPWHGPGTPRRACPSFGASARHGGAVRPEDRRPGPARPNWTTSASHSEDLISLATTHVLFGLLCSRFSVSGRWPPAIALGKSARGRRSRWTGRFRESEAERPGLLCVEQAGKIRRGVAGPDAPTEVRTGPWIRPRPKRTTYSKRHRAGDASARDGPDPARPVCGSWPWPAPCCGVTPTSGAGRQTDDPAQTAGPWPVCHRSLTEVRPQTVRHFDQPGGDPDSPGVDRPGLARYHGPEGNRGQPSPPTAPTPNIRPRPGQRPIEPARSRLEGVGWRSTRRWNGCPWEEREVFGLLSGIRG